MILVIVNDQVLMQTSDEQLAREAAESAASAGAMAMVARVFATCTAKLNPTPEWVEAA